MTYITIKSGDLELIRSFAECNDTDEVIKIVDSILKEKGLEDARRV